MTYSPNLPISSGWKSTIQNAFQILRRIKFLTEDDFKWVNFDPQVDFGTMATNNTLSIFDMRGMRVGNTFWFHGVITATLAAVFTTDVIITIPYNISATASSITTGGAVPVQNAGVWEVGWWYGVVGNNKLNIRRGNVAAYTAGGFVVILSGFVEVI